MWVFPLLSVSDIIYKIREGFINMKKLFRLLPLACTCLLLSGCFSMKLDPTTRLDWGLEIKYAGSFEIKDYYDLGEEQTWPECVFIDCYIDNTSNKVINYIDISEINFKVDVEGVDGSYVNPDDPSVIARSSFGCSQRLNIQPKGRYYFQLPFYNYEKKYFTDNPIFDEKTASFVTDMVINPVPALSGLEFTLISADIDEDGYLQANFMVKNYTGVVVKDITLNFIKGFDVIGNPGLESSYKRVLFADHFESSWKDANLEKDSVTEFTIPFAPYNDTYDAEFFSEESGVVELVVNYTFTH